ncbi:MAG: efflux RND transporter periplasmic adaptor subunit [Planctomycetia bacterium]|nr:efflux RND transporter periplasmic adaptor subunit [Planctomycetia bacterium]
MATSSESRLTASPNGDLVNRVQQLRLDNQLGTGRASSRGSWLPWVLCGLLAITWASVGVRWYKAAQKTDDTGGSSATTNQPGGQPGAPVAPGEIVTTLKGTVTPSLQVNLSPVDVSGELLEIYFKEGDSVKQGQVLGKLRDTRYLNDFKRTAAMLKMAEARLADLRGSAVRPEERKQMVAELDEAKANLKRAQQELARLNSQKMGGVVSAQDLERAEADVGTFTARVTKLEQSLTLLNMGARKEKIAEAEGNVDDAKAAHDEAKRLLDNCQIRAPIDGTVLTKAADKGMLVSPMSFNVAAGICSMADLAKLEVEIDVPERQIVRLKTGQECVLRPDANTNKVYRGVVDRVMPIADDSKNVVKVRVRVYLSKDEKPGSFLKPKMSVTTIVYNRDFVLNPDTDLLWGDEHVGLWKIGEWLQR